MSRPSRRKEGYKYRICRKCGKDWNVPINYIGGKIYLCPACTEWRAERKIDK